MQVQRIEDDGTRFIIHGREDIAAELATVFDNMAMGISVTEPRNGKAHILYTENNRDIVLNVLKDIIE